MLSRTLPPGPWGMVTCEVQQCASHSGDSFPFGDNSQSWLKVSAEGGTEDENTSQMHPYCTSQPNSARGTDSLAATSGGGQACSRKPPIFQCPPVPQGTPFLQATLRMGSDTGEPTCILSKGWFYFQSLISRPRTSINWSYNTWLLSWIEGECLILNYVARLPVYSNTCTKYDLPPWNYILIWSHVVY